MTMRLLIATWDTPFRETVARHLRGAGYDVTEVVDGVELLELARREKPRLILLDAMMPRIDGFEALKQLSEDAQLAGIPAVLMIGMPADASWFTGAIGQPQEFFQGPFIPRLVVVKPYLTEGELPRLAQAIDGLIGSPV